MKIKTAEGPMSYSSPTTSRPLTSSSAKGPNAMHGSQERMPHRIDYIVMLKGYMDPIEACSALYCIDNGSDPVFEDDHYPVKLVLAYEIMSSTSKGVPELDEHKLAGDACRHKFSHQLQRIPRPAWCTNINDHLALITEKIT
eukprot:4365971-Pyramimonas_sp.AAC.1